MSSYRKLIAALVGVALMWAEQNTNVPAPADVAPWLVDLVLATGTALGVWGLRNEPS